MIMVTLPAPPAKIHAASTATVFWLSLLGMILFLTLARWCALWRFRKMARLRQRQGGTGSTAFFAYLQDHGLSVEQSQMVYRYFQDCLPNIKGFPVELDDQLGHVLGICGPDVDNTILDIAAMIRCRVAEEAEFSCPQTVRDVLDVVLKHGDRRETL